MSALAIIVNIILILVSIILIVAVLLQQGQRQGLGAITGGAETFLGKNKAKSYEGKLALITKIGAAVFIVLAIVATILTSQIEKKNSDDLSALISDDILSSSDITSSADLYSDDIVVAETTEEPEATAEPTEEPEATDEPAETEAADAEATAEPTDAE